jgi:DNA-binding GntR family transcriptional regulator
VNVVAGEADRFGDLRIRETPKTLRALALDRVRSAILELRFQPGERLTERDLCAQLGVSRSVVREVIRHLETEGLIQNVPFHGPVVASLDPDQVQQIYEIRSQLESAAAAACAQLATAADKAALGEALQLIDEAYVAEDFRAVLAATNRFYEIMFESGRKTVAWEMVQRLNGRISRLRAMTVSSPNRRRAGMAQMRKILAAINKGDAAAAEKSCQQHVANAAALALDLLRQQQAVKAS